MHEIRLLLDFDCENDFNGFDTEMVAMNLQATFLAVSMNIYFSSTTKLIEIFQPIRCREKCIPNLNSGKNVIESRKFDRALLSKKQFRPTELLDFCVVQSSNGTRGSLSALKLGRGFASISSIR
jgi:hypothetical protein